MAPPKSRNIVVMVTAPNEDNALTIARALVEERLAACANLLGAIRSIYRWQDKVEDEREQLLVIKTRSHLFDALQSRVKQLHPYEVPEIIALPIDQGSKPYLDCPHQMEHTSRILPTAKQLPASSISKFADGNLSATSSPKSCDRQ